MNQLAKLCRKTPNIFWAAAVIMAVCIIGGSAHAEDIAYQQAPKYTPLNAWTISFASSDGGFRTYDNFTLSATSNILAVRWIALYYDQNIANNPVSAMTNPWEISFYADNGGGPGSRLSNNILPAGSVTATPVALRFYIDSTVRIYQFEATLPIGFQAEAGKKYWFSPLSMQSSFYPAAAWIDGKGGDGFSVQQELNPNGTLAATINHNDDRAFTLFTVAHPDPITVGGPWYEFLFRDAGSSAEACVNCAGSPSDNSAFAPNAPWKFTAPANGALLTVTDVQQPGDSFNVLDFGTVIGSTPAVAASSTANCGLEPAVCLADPSWSHGVFVLAPGPHSISFTVKTSQTGGNVGLGYFRVDPGPAIPVVNAIVNGATFKAKGAAPNSFVSLFGLNLGSQDTKSNIFPATIFNGISVLFNGTPAPLYFVFGSAGQINLVLPSELPESGTVTVQVKNALGTSFAIQLQMAQTDVGLFRIADPSNAKRNNGAVLFANTAWKVMPASMAAAIGFSSCEGASAAAACGQPAKVGDVVQIYVTGLGKATPNGDPSGQPLRTGSLAPNDGNPLYKTVQTPTVTIGGIPAQVSFSGIAPGNAGLYQINVEIPAGVQPGDDVPVVVTMTAGSSDTVTIAIR